MRLSLVLSVALLATAAFAAPHRVEAADGATAKTADYQRPDVKHLCLKENKQYNCRYVGCPAVQSCSADEDCYNCETHAIGQSDVVCCNKPDYGYGEGNQGDLFTPPSKVGTCDWDIDIYRCRSDTDLNKRALEPAQDCQEAIQMENGAWKVGTAWATCYLNADAEYCGHPFCDRMVMSFQGGVYVMDAYSKTLGGLTANGVTTDDSGTDGLEDPVGCFPYDSWIDGQGGNVPVPTPRGAAPAPAAPGAKAPGPKISRKKMSALSRAIQSTGLLKKYPNLGKRKASKHTAHIESADYYHGTHNTTWYKGVAVMFTGPVTVTSMSKHMEYSRGMLEYTPWFYDDGEGPLDGTKPAAKATVVRPNTYDIVLVADKAGDYGYEKDSYYKPEYKEEHYDKDYYKKDEYKGDYYKKDDYKPEYKEGRYYKDEKYYMGEEKHERDGYYPHEERRYRM